jgi:hypothetical protein
LQTKAKFLQPGFSGTFSQKFYMKEPNPSTWQVSSSYYAGAAISGIMYCDCRRRSKSVPFETWDVGFGKLEWAIIIGTSAIVSNYCYLIANGTSSYLGEAFNVVGIILRQGSNSGFVLALFNLGMYCVSLLFGNTTTSSIVAPGKHTPFDLAELVNEGYRILVIAQTTNEFASELPYLLDKFNNPRTFAEKKIFVFFYFNSERGRFH